MKKINPEISYIQENIFIPLGIHLSNIVEEYESQNYFAHTFVLNNQITKFRIAKITPKKSGQFVTVWKRNSTGITEAFHINDNIKFLFIAIKSNENFGVFIFPIKALLENKIISDEKYLGKRGFRVYSTWDKISNKQAQNTQLWQDEYFIDLSTKEINLCKVQKLFSLNPEI